MKRYCANFFDKNGDETRSITVEASSNVEAEEKAIKEADNRKWPESFRLGDVEVIS